MKIYVASSWRNEFYPTVVKALLEAGHEVYDFRNPPNGTGFSWSEIDDNWQEWTPNQYIEYLDHPIAERGFQSDFQAMQWADTCVMVLPCGRSANTEAGWMKGAGKSVFVFQPIRQEPELMYKIYDQVVSSLEILLAYLEPTRVCESCRHKLSQSYFDNGAERCYICDLTEVQ